MNVRSFCLAVWQTHLCAVAADVLVDLCMHAEQQHSPKGQRNISVTKAARSHSTDTDKTEVGLKQCACALQCCQTKRRTKSKDR
eukprot:8817-Heterococcus_DN1.PRE.2